MAFVEDVRPVALPPIERDLDLEKIALVGAERSFNSAKKPTFYPIGAAVDNDPVLRRYYLMARSVIAVAFERGALVARLEAIDHGADEPSNWLIIGQGNRLASSAADLATLITREGAAEWLAADLLVPVSRFDGGWRTQLGWVAVKNPVADDESAIYNWVRPSYKWLRTARKDGTKPLEAIVTARRLDQHPIKSMHQIFAEALARSESNVD